MDEELKKYMDERFDELEKRDDKLDQLFENYTKKLGSIQEGIKALKNNSVGKLVTQHEEIFELICRTRKDEQMNDNLVLDI